MYKHTHIYIYTEAGTPLATLDKWVACSQAAATVT